MYTNPYDDLLDGYKKFDPSGKEIVLTKKDYVTGFDANFEQAWGQAFENSPIGNWLYGSVYRDRDQELLKAHREGVLTDDDWDFASVPTDDGDIKIDYDTLVAIYNKRTGRTLETNQELHDKIREEMLVRKQMAEAVYAKSTTGGTMGRWMGAFSGYATGDPAIPLSLVGGLLTPQGLARGMAFASRARLFAGYNAGVETVLESTAQVFASYAKERYGIEADPRIAWENVVLAATAGTFGGTLIAKFPDDPSRFLTKDNFSKWFKRARNSNRRAIIRSRELMPKTKLVDGKYVPYTSSDMLDGTDEITDTLFKHYADEMAEVELYNAYLRGAEETGVEGHLYNLGLGDDLVMPIKEAAENSRFVDDMMEIEYAREAIDDPRPTAQDTGSIIYDQAPEQLADDADVVIGTGSVPTGAEPMIGKIGARRKIHEAKLESIDNAIVGNCA